MKKKFFGALVVVSIAVGAMINVNLNKVSNQGDLALANVEALAQSESGDYCHLDCYHSPAICWRTEWTWQNMDAYCVRTGNPSQTCYAYKC